MCLSYSNHISYHMHRQVCLEKPGPRLNINTVFSGIGISIMKKTRSLYLLIFTIRFSILVNRHLYVEVPPEAWAASWESCVWQWAHITGPVGHPGCICAALCYEDLDYRFTAKHWVYLDKALLNRHEKKSWQKFMVCVLCQSGFTMYIYR